MAASAKSLAEDEINNLPDIEEDFETELNKNDIDNTVNVDELAREEKEKLKTHRKINNHLVGNIILIEENHSKSILQTTKEMTVDNLGLIHSGFIFGAAEYTAISSINEENIVVIGTRSKFLAPAKNGDLIEFEAFARFEDSRKREVKVVGKISDIKIFEAIFQVIILEKHILKTKIKNINKNYHTNNTNTSNQN